MMSLSLVMLWIITMIQMGRVCNTYKKQKLHLTLWFKILIQRTTVESRLSELISDKGCLDNRKFG
jgi:hypothetical protein